MAEFFPQTWLGWVMLGMAGVIAFVAIWFVFGRLLKLFVLKTVWHWILLYVVSCVAVLTYYYFFDNPRRRRD